MRTTVWNLPRRSVGAGFHSWYFMCAPAAFSSFSNESIGTVVVDAISRRTLEKEDDTLLALPIL